MSDGGNLGVGAERALDTILGGKDQPEQTERLTPAMMREKILATSSDVKTYDQCASYAARLVLEYLEADPATRMRIPVETSYDWKDFKGEGVPPVIEVGLYDRMKQDGVPIDDLGLTGFQWGYAFNCARYCMDLPPEPNPAIMTIG